MARDRFTFIGGEYIVIEDPTSAKDPEGRPVWEVRVTGAKPPATERLALAHLPADVSSEVLVAVAAGMALHATMYYEGHHEADLAKWVRECHANYQRQRPPTPEPPTRLAGTNMLI